MSEKLENKNGGSVKVQPLVRLADLLNEEELLELSPETGEPNFYHHPDCAGYCDYACQPGQNGFEIADKIGWLKDKLRQD